MLLSKEITFNMKREPFEIISEPLSTVLEYLRKKGYSVKYEVEGNIPCLISTFEDNKRKIKAKICYNKEEDKISFSIFSFLKEVKKGEEEKDLFFGSKETSYAIMGDIDRSRFMKDLEKLL